MTSIQVPSRVVPMTQSDRAAEYVAPVCDFEAFDGNEDDPSYAYCDLPHAHAGPHHFVF